MAYTNSPMVVYTKLSPNHSGLRTLGIDRITPHCVVGQWTAEYLGDWFMNIERQASSNYGIDRDGRVALYVEEKNRSWCSSSQANDQRAVTIECASDTEAPYAFRDVVYQTLIRLCTDICRRSGKKRLLWLEDRERTLRYSPAPDEMLLTVHRWYDDKPCPGDWMFVRMGDLASKVTARLADSADAPEKTAGEMSMDLRGLMRRTARLQSAAFIMAGVALVYGVLAATEGFMLPSRASGYAGAVLLGIVSTALAFWFFFAGMEKIGPSTAALVSTTEPVVVVICSVLVLSEPITLKLAIGGCLVLSALVLISLQE